MHSLVLQPECNDRLQRSVEPGPEVERSTVLSQLCGLFADELDNIGGEAAHHVSRPRLMLLLQVLLIYRELFSLQSLDANHFRTLHAEHHEVKPDILAYSGPL